MNIWADICTFFFEILSELNYFLKKMMIIFFKKYSPKRNGMFHKTKFQHTHLKLNLLVTLVTATSPLSPLSFSWEGKGREGVTQCAVFWVCEILICLFQYIVVLMMFQTGTYVVL